MRLAAHAVTRQDAMRLTREVTALYLLPRDLVRAGFEMVDADV
ncbi:Uncharacterised protein [Bordetella pertussis]|nr:Uncharacterised protein [Bordetella pertussis]